MFEPHINCILPLGQVRIKGRELQYGEREGLVGNGGPINSVPQYQCN